ncbi:MAG: NifA subfamily Fis family transcriptional regulator [Syntrophaceae bacterium]|nr:MAG: NifA subfamily Fis family transcriptional regulator [Syntrophaceae bacterium]
MQNIQSSPNLDRKRLLSLAALFDGSFSLDWLIEITRYKAGLILAVLDEEIEQGLLVKQPEWFFAFKDSEMQKKGKEHFTLEEKEYWHRQIAKFLLKELPGDVRNIAAAAGHLLHIQNDINGCRLLLSAADVLSHTKALCYYDKIMEDLSKIQDTEADILFVETVLKYSEISWGRVDSEKMCAILLEAITKAEKLGLYKEISLIEVQASYNDFFQSRYGRAVEHCEKGWEIAKSIEAPDLLRLLTPIRTMSFFHQGHLKDLIRSYEESAPVIEKFSLEKYDHLVLCTVGLAYALNGQFSQGLGLLDAIRKHCLENDNQFIANQVNVHMASLMIQLHYPDKAIPFLNNIIISDDEGGWDAIRANAMLAYACYLKGQKEEAFNHLKYWLERRWASRLPIVTTDLWFEICRAMEEGEFPQFEGIRLEDEIKFYIGEENILLKGIAYRYQALLQEREGQSPQKIIETLTLSYQLLEESGAIFEQCRTLKALLQQHTLKGNRGAIKETKNKIMTILGSFSLDYVPNDLKGFIKANTRDSESLVEEILSLSQEMSAIRDEKKLMQLILSTSNRITGAERGAIFSIKKDGHKFQIRLMASKNITSVQVDNQDFSGTTKMIEEVAETGKGQIARLSSNNAPIGSGQILSQICVPMVIRNKVVGVLYHDNSIFLNSFKEADMKLLSYFAAQAAIALDHAVAYTNIQQLNHRLNQEKQYYKEQSFENIDFKDIIGKSQSILKIFAKIKQVADTGTTVLILGETGVGKELVARALHNQSCRRNQPFIKVLCNALPETLIASELFGHEKGAFTGSAQRRIGRFELADRGTLFLDEIGDLPPDVQTGLLHVLQSKEFERVGGSQTIRSDFRLITATNRNIEEAVRNKKFRSDLYYRLNVFPIYVPALRERKEDIPLLAYHFFKIFSARMGKSFEGISQKEMNKLTQHSWPGNIRELEGIIERSVIMSSGPYFQVPELGAEQKESLQAGAIATLQEMERSHILHTLEKTGWKVRGPGGAAEVLDMNYSTLALRMRKLGIVRPPEYARGRVRGT